MIHSCQVAFPEERIASEVKWQVQVQSCSETVKVLFTLSQAGDKNFTAKVKHLLNHIIWNSSVYLSTIGNFVRTDLRQLKPRNFLQMFLLINNWRKHRNTVYFYKLLSDAYDRVLIPKTFPLCILYHVKVHSCVSRITHNTKQTVFNWDMKSHAKMFFHLCFSSFSFLN